MAAREKSERELDTVKKKFDEALKVCQKVSDECARVRRRNEHVERELENLKARLHLGEDGVGIDEVFKNLGQMETIIKSKSNSAMVD